VEPSCGSEKAEDGADHSDAFGSGRGFEPEVAGDAEAKDKESGQRDGKQPKSEQKTSGRARSL
jgi:hypothetical protein